MGFEDDWREWRASRDEIVSAEYGPAALESTNWLITEPAAVGGIPGLWALTGDGGVKGIELGRDGAHVVLRPGERLRIGRRELRMFDRDGIVALRVFNPQRPERAHFSGIDAYRPDARWQIAAAFEEVDVESSVEARHEAIDGVAIVGQLRFTLDGSTQRLKVTRRAQGGLSAVFADGTSGMETFRFRHLTIAEPGADGTAVIDFNRAHLPPCAFSDQYVCSTPPAGNRYSSPIRAGERAVLRGR